MHETVQANEETLLQEALAGRPIALPQTNWSGIALTLMMPLTVAATFAWLALRTEWNDTGEWVLGMLMLIPFEFVRIAAFWILSDAYSDFRAPVRAAGFYLAALLAIGLIILAITATRLGLSDTLAALLDPQTWSIIGVPAALVAIDGVVALFAFRGDPRCEAARLEAQGDDARDWFLLTMFGVPFLLLLPCFVLFEVMQGSPSLPDWLPRGGDGARAVCLLYVSVYFAVKGLLLAQVHGARFMTTGRRVLAGRLVQFLLARDAEERRDNAREEAKKVAARRRLFMGEEDANDT